MSESYPSIQVLRKAIPADCLKPHTRTSIYYTLRDVFLALTLGFSAWSIVTELPEGSLARFTAWMVYGLTQGLVFTGLWVIGHECGHGSLFSTRAVNDAVGYAVHTLLLVPYFSWKYSHQRHHRFIGHATKDAVFVPAIQRPNEDASNRPPGKEWLQNFEDAPIYQAMSLLFRQIFGWPMYLFFNATSGIQAYEREFSGSHRLLRSSHFDPGGAIFRNDAAKDVVLSNIGLCAMLGALFWAARHDGTSTIVCLYLVPYLWTNHWIVAITYLHHTHPDVPRYNDRQWTYTKGALATVDRDFGWIGRNLFHGIIETHLVHHLFPRVPFYRANEATEAIKPHLGHHYMVDNRNFWKQLWTHFRDLKFMEEDPKWPGTFRWVKP